MTPENRSLESSTVQVKSLLHFEGCYYALVFFDYVAGYCLANKRGARDQIILTSLFKFICEFREGS